MTMKQLSVRDLCHIGFFTALISVCAQLSIPMPAGVPLTLQTFAILFAGIVLGPKKGAMAALVYALLGAAGAPVFSGFKGGLAAVLGPTGGFIYSFPIMAICAGVGERKNNKVLFAFWLLTGMVVNYLCGMLVYSRVMSCGLAAAFAACVLPYIPTALLKTFLAAVLGKSVKVALVKSGVGVGTRPEQ